MYILQFDGMLHQLTGRMEKAGLLGYGWLITNNDNEVGRGFGVFAHKHMASSNIAEYLALIEGLEALTDLRIWKEPIAIRGDAKCVIDQMKGVVSISSIPTRRLRDRARWLANHFDILTWTWVPRNHNKPADKLSRRGLRQLHAIPNAYENVLTQLKNQRISGGGLISVMDLRVYTPLN